MTCPSCGKPTIVTPAGNHLNPQGGRLGRTGRDGIELTPDEIRNTAIRGYYPHHCTPSTTTAAPTSQDALF